MSWQTIRPAVPALTGYLAADEKAFNGGWEGEAYREYVCYTGGCIDATNSIPTGGLLAFSYGETTYICSNTYREEA